MIVSIARALEEAHDSRNERSDGDDRVQSCIGDVSDDSDDFAQSSSGDDSDDEGDLRETVGLTDPFGNDTDI